MFIGSAQWGVALEKYDFQYAKNTMVRFSKQPREGNMNGSFRIFGYLKHDQKTKIHFDPQQINTEERHFIYDNK